MIFLREVDGDDGVAAHAVALGIGLERRQIDDGQLGNEIFELGLDWTDQKLADEQRMPSQLGEDPRFYPVFRIGAAVEVLREQLLAARMSDEVVIQQLEIGLAELAIAVPPDGVLGERIDDGVLVLGAASGMGAGLGAQCAARNDGRFARLDGVLVKLGGGKIPVDRGKIFKAKSIGAIGAVAQTRFLHGRPPLATGRRRNSLPHAVFWGTAGPTMELGPEPATYSGDRTPCQDRRLS